MLTLAACHHISPQFLSDQITRYISDVLDHTDETLGELPLEQYGGRIPYIALLAAYCRNGDSEFTRHDCIPRFSLQWVSGHPNSRAPREKTSQNKRS